MFKYILTLFKQQRKKIALSYRSIDITFDQLFTNIRKIIQILNVLKVNKTTTVGIWEYNTPTWIILFIACLLRGVKTVLIHPNEDITDVHWQINDSQMYLLFANKKLLNGFDEELHPFLSVIIRTDMKKVWIKTNDNKLRRDLQRVVESTPKKINSKTPIEFYQTFDFGIKQRDTSFIKYIDNIHVIYPVNATEDALRDHHNRIPIGGTVLIPEDGMSFVENPVLYALFPFYMKSRLIFVPHMQDLCAGEVVWIKKRHLERIWKEQVTPWINRPWYWLFPILLGRRRLKQLFPNLEELIIIDKAPSAQVMKNLHSMKIRYAVLKEEGTYITIQEEYENMLNDLPYVVDNLVVKYKDKIVVLVNVDETHNWIKNNSVDDVNHILEDFRLKVNEHVPRDMNVDKILIYPEEFERSPNGDILKYLYQAD